MYKGKGKMLEDEKEEKEEEVAMDIDGDEAKQGNEDIGVQISDQSELDTMNSMQTSLPSMKGTATSDEANPRKRKPSFMECGEKSLKMSTEMGYKTNRCPRRVPPVTDASSPKGNTDNTASSASLAQDSAPLPPPVKSSLSHHEPSSSSQLIYENKSESSSSSASVAQQCAPESFQSAYDALVQLYLQVINATTQEEHVYYGEFLEVVRAYNRFSPASFLTNPPLLQQIVIENVYAQGQLRATAKGPLGSVDLLVQDLWCKLPGEDSIDTEDVEIESSRMFEVQRSAIASTVKTLTTKDLKTKVGRLRFLQPFALRVKSLLNPPESVEAGVEVNILDNQLRTFNVKLKSYDGILFLLKGWDKFLLKNDWVAKIKIIKIAAFRHFESGELSFIVLPAEKKKKK